MYNYSTHVFTNVIHIECPRVWLFHAWHSTRCVHSMRGITRDVSIPPYEKRGPREHVMRFILPMLCYHPFAHMENEIIIEQYVFVAKILTCCGAWVKTGELEVREVPHTHFSLTRCHIKVISCGNFSTKAVS